MAHYFFSDSPNILPCEGTGIGYKSVVKLKFFAQPMHQVFVIKYCIFLETSLSEILIIRMSYWAQVWLSQ